MAIVASIMVLSFCLAVSLHIAFKYNQVYTEFDDAIALVAIVIFMVALAILTIDIVTRLLNRIEAKKV